MLYVKGSLEIGQQEYRQHRIFLQIFCNATLTTCMQEVRTERIKRTDDSAVYAGFNR